MNFDNFKRNLKSPDDWVVDKVVLSGVGLADDVEAVDWLGSDVEVGGNVWPIIY
jgi:hypothetical protein